MTGSNGPRHDGYDDLRRALRIDAERAARTDAQALWSRVGPAVQRRRRHRRAAGALAATTLSAVLGVAVLQVLPPGAGGDRDRLATGGRSAPAASPSVQSAGPAAPSVDATAPPGPARTPLEEQAIPVTPDAARVAAQEAGYSQDDLWQIARTWRWGNVRDVEVVAGARLLRGEALPLRPGQSAREADQQAVLWLPYENLLAYTGAGYNGDDAAALAQRWRADEALVRMLVGELLRAGELPPGTG